MDRRDFLKATAALTAGGATGTTMTACGGLSNDATVLPSANPAQAAELQQHICQLENNLAAVSSALGPADTADESGASDSHLAQQCVRSLLIAGLYSELSEADRQHPAVQARMREAMPEISDTVEATLERIESLTSTERSELHRQLEADPELPQRSLDQLAAKAAEVDVPPRRIRQLRSLAKRVTWRMAQQNPGLVLHEYAEKARRSQQKAMRTPAIQRRVALALGQHALWVEHGDEVDNGATRQPSSSKVPEPPTLPQTPDYTESTTQPAAPPTPQPPTVPPATPAPNPENAQPNEQCPTTEVAELRKELRRIRQYRKKYSDDNARTRRKYLVAGGWLMGVGVVAGGFAPLTIGISATIGAIMLVVGIVLMGLAGGRKRLPT